MGSVQLHTESIIRHPVREKAFKRAAAQEGSQPKLISIPGSWRHKAERTASLFESFFHAFRGFWISFKAERNMRIHTAVALIVALAAVLLHIDRIGCVMLVLAIGMVVTAELLNTALERLVDIASNNEFHRVARDAKDIAAAAVLCSAAVAAIIGGLVFVPQIMILLVR